MIGVNRFLTRQMGDVERRTWRGLGRAADGTLLQCGHGIIAVENCTSHTGHVEYDFTWLQCGHSIIAVENLCQHYV